MNTALRLGILGGAALALLVAAVCLGPTQLLDVPRLVDLLRSGPVTPELQRAQLVLWELRLPRVLLAAAAGVNLALGGLLLQAIFRNPLAEPYLLGLSSGGALGAVASDVVIRLARLDFTMEGVSIQVKASGAAALAGVALAAGLGALAGALPAWAAARREIVQGFRSA